MNLKNTIFILIIILFLFQMLVMKQDAQIARDNQKPNVAVSTFSLFDITKNIAGDTVNIIQILPFGVDVHAYEPNPKQVAKLYDSDLVIYSGANLEPWCKNFEFKNKVLNISKLVNLKTLDEEDSDHEEEHHHHGDNAVDPHYWLDIDNMVRAAISISEELINLNPQKKKNYEENKNLYISKIKKLDNEYKKQLSSCSKETILVNHNAYSYLANRYNFSVEALSGLSPDAMPSAKSMINLIEHIKEHKVKTIFFESFASDKAIKSISNEAKIDVEVLHTLGNITAGESHLNLSYEDIMRENLNKISNALECK